MTTSRRHPRASEGTIPAPRVIGRSAALGAPYITEPKTGHHIPPDTARRQMAIYELAAIEGAAFHPLGDAERERQFTTVIGHSRDRHAAALGTHVHMQLEEGRDIDDVLNELERYTDPYLDIARDLA